MKKTTLALMMIGLGVVSASSNAAEIYNKNGNKLDLYGKIKAMHYFTDDTTQDGDKTLCVTRPKAKRRLTIN